MRLIDADLIINNINEEIKELGICPEDISKILTKICIDLFIKTINDQPTVYDVDDILEKLQYQMEYNFELYQDTLNSEYLGKYRATNEIIDMIKNSFINKNDGCNK